MVLGAAGAGKSTFVQKALDLRQAPSSPSSAKKMSLDGVIYLVRLLEIPLEDVSIAESQKIIWPEFVGDHDMPLVDGVLALYDVTNQASAAEIPDVLSKCHHVSLNVFILESFAGCHAAVGLHTCTSKIHISPCQCISMVMVHGC